MTRTLNPLRNSRTSCSVLALAAVMAFGATPAQAQFVGTIDSSAGIDTVNSTNSNLIITGQQAVINWTANATPSGGQIDFLPEGNSATFSSGSDFAVLNRITPGTAGNAIFMGGNISSFAGDFTGGTVYFYSPNGIIIGQNASINVGSLGLTTLPIADDGEGNWMTDFGGSNPKVVFGQATNPNSFIRTETVIDGSINANGAGNYVALVAPVINHRGTIRTDGGAALVAAEAASITFSDSGLYNIEVTTGSEALQSLTVNGGKIMRNSEAIGGDRHAYLVAVPKNDVTTMLIMGGAELGFDIAGSAGVEGNTVVLNAGFNTVDEFGFTYLPDTAGNLTIDNASFTSNVETIAHGDTQISTNSGPTSFSGNLDITNDFTAFVGATTNDLTIGGDLDIHTFYLWSVFDQPSISLWAGAGATLSTGNVDLRANTQGSNAPDEFSPGESVTGGTINITANDGGQLVVNGSLYGEANGTGGSTGNFGGIGGDGTGGTINVSAIGTGSSISAGTTELYAYGNGGSTSECLSCDISGGIGHGGTINVQLGQGATSMTFGPLNTWAIGTGGYGAGGDGGDGIGGTSNLSIGGGSTLTVNGNYFNFADGGGGGAEGAGNAGDGHGGSAALFSTAGGGQIFFKGANSYITADAGGGAATGTGDGGDAFTGSASINVTNTAINVANAAQTQPFGQLYVKSDAFGGASAAGAGGSADASTGPVSITLGAGSSLAAGRLIVTEANATGGNGVSGGAAKGGVASINVDGGGTLSGNTSQFAVAIGGTGTTGPGGDATGGTAWLNVNGGTAVPADYLADASATGGNSTSGGGGNAVGGLARVLVLAGTANFGDLTIRANATGGSTTDGSGGNAQSGRARLFADGGDVIVGSDLTLESISTGGNGAIGGDAIAFIGTNPLATALSDARVVAGNGSIAVTGSTSLDASAFGGAGSNGGAGGDASAGYATVHALNRNAGEGTVTLDGLQISADATGGNGGSGTSGVSGGDGADGGSATGGLIAVTASAGNGHLDIGDAIVSASAFGGNGGTGGFGSNGPGGNAGNGGTATGGFINIGTESGVAQATNINEGTASFTSISATADATGGDGGDVGLGTGFGLAGDGGDAFGGTAVLLVRGSTLNVGDVTLEASATGGNGGLDENDAYQGNGGNAESDEVGVLVTNRAGNTAQRGYLNAGAISGTANSTGGSGAMEGVGAMEGGTGFIVENSDADIVSLDLNVVADSLLPDVATDSIAVVNGTVQVEGGFSFNTSGVASIHLDDDTPFTPTVTANIFTVSASNFIHDPQYAGPSTVGAISADAIDIATGGDFVTDANLYSTASLDIIAPGLIDIRDAISSGGDLTLQAGTTITGGAQSAAGSVFVGATDNILLGSIDAGNLIDIYSETGGIALGSLSAGSSIDLEAADDIGFGNVTADTLDFETGGAVTGGDIVAATEANGEAQGAVNLGNISVGIQMEGGASEDGFAVGITSATSINVLDVEADESIGFATFGPLTTGDLSAGGNIMALASGDMTFGSMATTGELGQIYLADSSMYIDAGGPDDFIPSLVLGAEPVPTSGSITINGPVSTSLFRAAAGGNFTAGDITALGFFDQLIFAQGINVRAGGTATVDGTWTGESVHITSNDIDIAAGGGIDAGDVALASTNATRTIVGDGVTGGGYQLSNAEYNRIHSSGGEIEVGVNGSLGGALNMIVGDLSVDAAQSGAGEYEFATYQTDSEEGSGSIRVVGDMAFTNMGDIEFDNEVSFTTRTFQLDAATGSLFLTGSGSDLAGSLDIAANNIHVAEGSILDQLADDPQYDGYREDLNAPAAVQRPEGVIGASAINLEFGGTPADLYTLYVQNTGTSDVPAGFVISDLGLEGDGEGGLPPNSLDVVINGQIVTGQGTLTGIDVRDALVASEEGDLTPFTATSTVNGCLLTGACVETPNNPFPPDFTPTPGIQDEIVLIGDDPAPPPEFGNEDVIDDNDEETEDTSPIVPPQPLFDTSEMGEAEGTGNPAFNTTMRSSPGIKQEGDIDDPVSGGGNPALMESPPAPPAGSQENQQ